MKLNIVKNIKIWIGISAVLMIAAFIMIFSKGLNYGIDFAGGNIFQIEFKIAKDEFKMEELNNSLDKIALKVQQLEPAKRRVQQEQGDKTVIIIRTSEMTEETKNIFLQELKNEYKDYELLGVEKVGASIGKELKTKSTWALIIGCIIILVYIRIRFSNFMYGAAALIALIHDIVISVGVIAFLGYEINTPFIAAVLTILGYSINDTIVIFDRIRENKNRMIGTAYVEVIDLSINQTLVRSINTSLTTFLAVLALLLFGGATLKTFITTLAVGILIGTYSSIFVASPIAYILDTIKNGKSPIETEKK